MDGWPWLKAFSGIMWEHSEWLFTFEDGLWYNQSSLSMMARGIRGRTKRAMNGNREGTVNCKRDMKQNISIFILYFFRFSREMEETER